MSQLAISKSFFAVFTKALSVLMVAGLISCNEIEEGTTQKEIEDRDEVFERYQPLVGKYEGTVDPDDEGLDPYPVALDVFITEEAFGNRDNGEIKFRYALRGVYRRLDLEDDISNSYFLVVGFIPETRDVSMVTPGNSPIPGRPGNVGFLSISAELDGEVLTGRIETLKRPGGRLELHRI